MKETNQIVKKSNDLITAKYRLTIIQQYVLHNVISQIHIEDTDFKKYEVNVRSIAENHGIDTKNAYRYIKKSALELNKQPIIIGDEIEGIALNWFFIGTLQQQSRDITCRFPSRLKALSASTARLLHAI